MIANAWADTTELDAPYLIQDYVINDINSQQNMDKYIDSWIYTMRGDYPDVIKASEENKTINGTQYTVATVLYTKNSVKWKDLQYYTPNKCGKLCYGYTFTIRAPQALFDKMKPSIIAFEKSL
jgi:hypothetical protein